MPDRPTLRLTQTERGPAPSSRRSFGLTDVGRKRKANEDALFLDDALGLYVVCDGMGGHAAGEIASQEAIETLYGMVKRGVGTFAELAEPLREDDVRAALRLIESGAQAATYMVFGMAELDREKKGMGTTLTALLVSGAFGVIAQVGDSRIYRVRGGTVRQLTEDHTLVAWQVKQGILTEAEALRSPHKNVITRAVGNRDYVEVDTLLVDLRAGDRYVLCSDGLHGYLRDGDLLRLAEQGGQACVDGLIALANERGGKDNITAIVLELD